MPRCPSCEKFVSLEFAEIEEPEASDETSDGTLAVQVRLVRTCAECGDEMKTAELEIELDFTDAIQAHMDEKHPEIDTNADDYTPTEVVGINMNTEQIEESGGRYAKSYFGASVEAFGDCALCGAEITATGSDKIAASQMDEAF